VKRSVIVLALACTAAASAAAFATVTAPTQTSDVLARIRHEGLDRSMVQALFATLTDQFGPRLTGTPAHKQAAECARDRMREFELTDPRLEPWAFGRGWVLDRLVVEMVEPRYMPLIGYAEAWSAPTTTERIARP
jgi:carboxypeptidase Q